MANTDSFRVGLISDTHGLLRPAVRTFLIGCDYIVHGGDIGGPAIVRELQSIAPLIAVRGNNDRQPWANKIADTELRRVGNVFVYVLHDLSALDFDVAAVGVRVVISGHSHKPRIEERAGILYLNPGSCGPRRFRLPVSVGELTVTGSSVHARLVDLAGDSHAATSPFL
jgi:uncharacterized protein